MTFTYFIALNTIYRPFCTGKPLPLNGSHEGVMIGTSMHTSYTLWGEGARGVPLLLAYIYIYIYASIDVNRSTLIGWLFDETVSYLKPQISA